MSSIIRILSFATVHSALFGLFDGSTTPWTIDTPLDIGVAVTTRYAKIGPKDDAVDKIVYPCVSVQEFSPEELLSESFPGWQIDVNALDSNYRDDIQEPVVYNFKYQVTVEAELESHHTALVAKVLNVLPKSADQSRYLTISENTYPMKLTGNSQTALERWTTVFTVSVKVPVHVSDVVDTLELASEGVDLDLTVIEKP